VTPRFVQRYLDPGERLGELLFGFIMTLTFTIGMRLAIGEEGAVRELLVGVIGCNIAWGIIDGLLLVLGRVFERGRAARIAQRIATTRDPDEALTVVGDELDERLSAVTSEATRLALYRDVIEHVRARTPPPPRTRGDDWFAAVAVFCLVFLASLPAAAPFALIDDPWIALRTSNAVLIALVFFVGWKWAAYTTLRPWLAGAKLAGICLLLVLIAIPLGG
jgi:VIT1/CCC1 family predicted Fe2+/Mn2+ transporter